MAGLDCLHGVINESLAADYFPQPDHEEVREFRILDIPAEGGVGDDHIDARIGNWQFVRGLSQDNTGGIIVKVAKLGRAGTEGPDVRLAVLLAPERRLRPVLECRRYILFDENGWQPVSMAGPLNWFAALPTAAPENEVVGKPERRAESQKDQVFHRPGKTLLLDDCTQAGIR
jgi:hypothetical protein